jgi:glycosyltransferase involved in cell wall biosynthesis
LVGPLEPEAAAMLARAPSNVEWVGVKKGFRLVKEYHESDLYILPSNEEGFGISILEALSTGLPDLVSTETGGKQSILQGQNGVILEDFSDYSFEAFLAPLLTQPQARLSMATAARQTVLKNHTEEHYRKTLQAEYLRMFSIVKKAGPALGPAWQNPCS